MAEKNRNSNPDENDVTEYQCHGDHWNAVLGNPANDFEKVLGKAVENGELVGSKNKNNLISFTEKDKNGEDNSVSVKMILSDNDGSAELISAYPCATHGAYVHVKIRKINEWENGLEATVEGELESGDIISFFDTDYLLHKDEYKIGKFCWFSLAGFAYTAEVLEKGAADFEFSGQEALDFNAKTGEEPEYDEEGNVKPVRFCLDNLVAYFPRECPDDAEFQSPLTGTKKNIKIFRNKTCFRVQYYYLP